MLVTVPGETPRASASFPVAAARSLLAGGNLVDRLDVVFDGEARHASTPREGKLASARSF